MDSNAATLDSAECRVVLTAATSVATQLVAQLWQVQGAELGTVLGMLDALAAVVCGARLAVVGEAEARGEISESQAGSTAGWVAEHAPTLAAGNGAGQVARLVRECKRPDLTTVQAAALSGFVSVPVALTVVSEFARLKPRLREEAAPTVLQGLLDMGIADGPRGVRSLRPALLAAHGADGEFQADADTAERLISLSRPSTDELGALTYQLILDPVGAAALEAAIGPLSAPVPGPDGERDARSPQTRRGQALVEVCRRATSAGDRPPSGVKTTLMLTMSYDDLAARIGAATVVGSAQSGSLIAPETVRRLACDAAIIPTVLGGRGEILDQGRSTRLATRRGNSRGRHHSVVHRDQLIGRVTADTGADTGTVTWDLIPGSYHRRDDGPPPRGGRSPGDQNPGDESPGDQLPGGLQPWDPPAHRQRRSPDYDKWDTPASTSDLWTDLWVDSRPGDDT
ncbi:MAG: DUF222 domain-containing protein [Actinomycetales bacterium]|uniref:DUF222 domain-containing protein n=1 Tax=Candidatus Phosphoribacter hodrii TaxID=2953743 RepID=A0A9D7Y2Y0_9MICO|nr:DUF222 domain-containing protein [Candidatus Phosphoribacter hodrii]